MRMSQQETFMPQFQSAAIAKNKQRPSAQIESTSTAQYCAKVKNFCNEAFSEYEGGHPYGDEEHKQAQNGEPTGQRSDFANKEAAELSGILNQIDNSLIYNNYDEKPGSVIFHDRQGSSQETTSAPFVNNFTSIGGSAEMENEFNEQGLNTQTSLKTTIMLTN